MSQIFAMIYKLSLPIDGCFQLSQMLIRHNNDHKLLQCIIKLISLQENVRIPLACLHKSW